MIQITETAATHTTDITVGDQLAITLAENITTGYHWELNPASCGAALHLDSDQAFRPDDPRPGAPGRHTWVFTAHHETNCELHFQSVRSWEKTATGNSLVFPIAIRKGA